jgi:hypothetical protein
MHDDVRDLSARLEREIADMMLCLEGRARIHEGCPDVLCNWPRCEMQVRRSVPGPSGRRWLCVRHCARAIRRDRRGGGDRG